MTKGKVGRPGIPDEVKQRVLKFLREGKSYSYISTNVTYKAKFGKVKHVSAPTISEIKKNYIKNNFSKKKKNRKRVSLKLKTPTYY